MRVLVIGATGGTGRAITTRALVEGHTVTAFARRAATLPGGDGRLKRCPGDVLDPAAVDAAVADQDAVICVLGATPTRRPVSVFSKGTSNVVAAMSAHAVRRIICITGLGCGNSRGHGGFLYDRIVLPFVLRTIYEDKERQEAIVHASGLDWIIVRPAFLTDGPVSSNFLALNDLDGVRAGRISRADVAMFVVRQLVDGRFLHQTPLVTGPTGGPPSDGAVIRATVPSSAAAAILVGLWPWHGAVMPAGSLRDRAKFDFLKGAGRAPYREV
jgi:putative NADH-flavin reductase